MRIRKGDRVVVRSGKYRGHRAEVVRVIPAENKVVLEGVNVAKRHVRPSSTRLYQSGIIDKFMPIDASAVSVVCSSCGPSRIGVRFEEDGRKVRVCRKCGADL